MHRSFLIAAAAGRAAVAAAILASGAARAEPAADDAAGSDQALAASLGVDIGGRTTPGGLHLGGAYLYQLSDQDWFEGAVSMTIGGSGAGCFRDRDDDFLCDHGIVHGAAGEVSAGVRRLFAGQGAFTPWARVALGARAVRFGGDDVQGFALPLHLGGGVRAHVARGVAVVGAADLLGGIGWFDHDLGAEPHIGLAVTGGAEFDL